MKRLFKNSLFTFFLGVILTASISVYATITYNANQIYYGNVKLDTALDELYSAVSNDTYTPTGNITPGDSNIVLPTNGKRLTSDITINAVSSPYYKLSNTTANESNILSGKTVYNGSGELLTGTLNIGDSAYSNISSSNFSSNYAGGARISNRSVSLNLTKGKYLVFGSAGYTGGQGYYGNGAISDFTPNLSYSNGTCTKLDAKFYDTYSTEVVANNLYVRSLNKDIIYKCSFTSSTTLTYTNSTTNSNTNAEEIRLYAIKLT